MATPISQTEAAFTQAANNLSRISTELHEAEVSRAPRWKLDRLRKEYTEAETLCNTAKKAYRQSH